MSETSNLKFSKDETSENVSTVPRSDLISDSPHRSLPTKLLFQKRIIKVVKFLVLTLVLLWIARILQTNWSEVSHFEWSPHWGWLIASGFFYLCGFFPAAIFWFLSLRWLGQQPSFFNSVLAYYSSQLGKYVPGKAMVVVIRTGMIASKTVHASVAAASVFYETLIMMGSGAFFSAIIVFFCFREHAYYSWMALGVAIISIIPLLPPVFARILKALRIGKNDAEIQRSLKNLRYRYLGIGFALMAFLWIFFALSLWSVIHGIGLTPLPLIETLPRYVASVALAMTLGFVVVISPGGLGIREAVLSALLIPYFVDLLNNPTNSMFTLEPEALSTIISILQRIVSIIAEGLAFAVMLLTGLLIKRRKPTD